MFLRGVIFLKKNSKERPGWMNIVIPGLAGGILYLAFSLLSADLILTEKIPEETGPIALCVSGTLAGFISGLLIKRREEKTWIDGVLAGAMIAMIVLLAKGVCDQDANWTIYTTITVSLCVLCSLAASCIFHKSNKTARKRKKRITARNNG